MKSDTSTKIALSALCVAFFAMLIADEWVATAVLGGAIIALVLIDLAFNSRRQRRAKKSKKVESEEEDSNSA